MAGCADRLHQAATAHGLTVFPIKNARRRLRHLLGTTPVDLPTTMPARSERAYAEAMSDFASLLRQRSEIELLIGFPPAPFILPLVVNDRSAFISYATRHPAHMIWIRRREQGAAAEWVATAADDENATYELSFVLPSGIEEWIGENEDRRRSRARMIKSDFLATITIYFLNDGELRVCHLQSGRTA